MGNIIAVGEQNNMILFTSNSENPTYGDWAELRLTPNSKMDYVQLEYTGRAGIAWQYDEQVQNPNISVSNSIVQHVFLGGIVLGPGDWLVDSNFVTDCGSEGISQTQVGTPLISNNTFTNSTVGIALSELTTAIIQNNLKF